MTRDQKARLTLDMGVALRTRLKIAAARRGVTMRALCLEAIERGLAQEETEAIAFGTVSVEAALAASRAILKGRTFVEDSTELIQQAREERAQGR